ncbi:hypothetical protein [Sorangium sp. So ce117]|uniref:hypothetical protein n=1 Tax=Sorangium sp. So ce117 TaxID=3133277 RepID=UPI003F5F42BE
MAASAPGPPSRLAARSAIGNTTDDPAPTPAKPTDEHRPEARGRERQAEPERRGEAAEVHEPARPERGVEPVAVWRRDQPNPAVEAFRALIEADLARRPARAR